MIDAGADLHQQQRGDDEKILADPPLAWRQRPERRQHRVHRRVVGIVQEELVDEQHHAEGEEGEAEADPGPTEGVGGGRVADQRLIGPVLGPGPVAPGRRATVVSEENTRKSAVWRGELRVEAVGRRPARGGIGDVQRLGEIVAQLTMAAATGAGATTSCLRQIDALQLVLHGRG